MGEMQPRRTHDEESSVEGSRAADSREDPGMETVGRAREEAEGVLTSVCLTCGKEYYFEREAPGDLRCEKCGSHVFRSFFTAEDDEASRDFVDSTARDLDPDDAEGDTLPGDVADLNRH
jgi:ribosomal protein L37AE/L43A